MKFIIAFILMFVPLFCDAKLTDNNFKNINYSTKKFEGNLIDEYGFAYRDLVDIYTGVIPRSAVYENDDYMIFIDGFVAHKYDKKKRTLRYAKLFDKYSATTEVKPPISVKIDDYFVVLNNKQLIAFDEDLHIIAKGDLPKSFPFVFYYGVFANKYFVVASTNEVLIFDKNLKVVRDFSYEGEEVFAVTGNDCLFISYLQLQEDKYHVSIVIVDANLQEKVVKIKIPGDYSFASLVPFSKDKFIGLFRCLDVGKLMIYDNSGNVLKEYTMNDFEDIFYIPNKVLFTVKKDNNVKNYLVKEDNSLEEVNLFANYVHLIEVNERLRKSLYDADFHIDTFSLGHDFINAVCHKGNDEKKLFLKSFDFDGNLIFSKEMDIDAPLISTYAAPAKDKYLYSLNKFDDYYFLLFGDDKKVEFSVLDKDFKEVTKRDVAAPGFSLINSYVSNIYPIEGGCFFVFNLPNDISCNEYDKIPDIDFDDLTNSKSMQGSYKYIVVNMKFNYKINDLDGIKSNIAEANFGDKVTFEVEDRDGYVLSSVSVVDSLGNLVKVTDNSFIMPESDVTIKANYEKIKNPNTMDIIVCFVLVLTISGIFAIYLERKRVKLR